jgi:hypothetical protein
MKIKRFNEIADFDLADTILSLIKKENKVRL